MFISCSTADAPTRDLLNSQHLANDELCGLVDYCYHSGTREGLQVAAMILLGIYGGLTGGCGSCGYLHLPTTAGHWMPTVQCLAALGRCTNSLAQKPEAATRGFSNRVHCKCSAAQCPVLV